MKFLITCWPFEGHVFPQMAVAQALAGRGHEVAFYSGEPARQRVEAAGVRFFGFSDLDERAYERVQAREAESGTRRQSLRVEHQAFRNWLVETIPGQVTDIRRIITRWRPDVIISDLTMWGPLLVLWQAEGIPVAGSSTFLGPMIPGPDAPPWGFGLAPGRGLTGRLRDRILNGVISVAAHGLRRRVDEIRGDHGLGPLGVSVNEFTGRLPLYLVPSLREIDYHRDDLPATVHYVGPCPWFPPSTEVESGWLESVPQDLPWVHVTEGTSHYQDPFLLRAASSGLAGTPVRMIGTTGVSRDPGGLGIGAPAANVHLTRWLSHEALLPRCSVVVTTGGPATILAALGAGVPLVVVPTTWDKPDNARRIVDSGLGVSVRPGRCTPARLRSAVLEVLQTPSYRENVTAVASDLAAAPGPSRSAELLEQLGAASPMATLTSPSPVHHAPGRDR
jgi:UDP:flavonoid glycosyltransferase YjiC (YdhE family)